MTRSSGIGILLVLVAAALSGCDDGGGAPPPTPTPSRTASATASVTATRSATPPATATQTPTLTVPPPSSTPTQTPTSSQTPTATAGHGCCGDGMAEEQWGEECDDGNVQGGDGCAPNCTVERSMTLDLAFSGASQTSTFLLEYQTQSRQTFRFGHRGGSRLPPCFDGYAPEEIPVAQRAADISFEPTSVPGLVCVCIHAVAVKRCGDAVIVRRGEDCTVGRDCTADAGVCGESEVCRWAHGEHNATSGTIGCLGLGFASYERTTDGDGGEDQCVRENESGDAPGSAFLFATTAVGVIQDGGTCETDTSDPRKGADGIPCNSDDPSEARGVSVTAPMTTARAAARVTYASGAAIAQGHQCGSAPCLASVVGRPFSCEALEAATPATGDFALCSAVGVLDDGDVGDYVYTGCAEPR